VNEQAAACLLFGVYERNGVGIVDRRECSVCHGDRCPYEVRETEHGLCPHCFGAGVTPVAAYDLLDRSDAICPHCQGTGRI
jgi:DnaJ-class molecular chaperone